MIKLACALLVVCLLGTFAPAGAIAAEAGRECAQIRVVGAEQWIPFSFRDPATGEARGIAVDVARWLGQRMQIPVTVRTDVPWKRLMRATEDNAVDMVAGVYGTKDQASRFALTVPIDTDEVRVFVAKGREFPLKEPADLIGHTGAALVGIRWSPAFETVRSRLTLNEVMEHGAALRMLLLHRVDYVVMPLYTGIYWLRELDATDAIVALPTPLASPSVHLAVLPRSPCRAKVAEMNRLLSEAKGSGIVEGIVRSYVHVGRVGEGARGTGTHR